MPACMLHTQTPCRCFMMYEVIRNFADTTDRSDKYPDGYLYRVGDSFPRKNKKVSKERARSLLTNQNIAGASFIKEKQNKESDE